VFQRLSLLGEAEDSVRVLQEEKRLRYFSLYVDAPDSFSFQTQSF
jgi:hypothetical protein